RNIRQGRGSDGRVGAATHYDGGKHNHSGESRQVLTHVPSSIFMFLVTVLWCRLQPALRRLLIKPAPRFPFATSLPPPAPPLSRSTPPARTSPVATTHSGSANQSPPASSAYWGP